MGTEEVLAAIAQIAMWILPVVGVVVLIYLALLFKKLIETLKEVDKTLVLVDDQVKKLDEPLATVQQISGSVDEIHNKARDVAKSASVAASDNITRAKDWFAERKNKEITYNEDPNQRRTMDEVADTVRETVLSVCDNVRERINEKRNGY